uniref:Uncharacterized protein n=1 Tax=Lygus hesperus TaxID=30085 RepID=A0A0K8SSW8_LYGHE
MSKFPGLSVHNAAPYQVERAGSRFPGYHVEILGGREELAHSTLAEVNPVILLDQIFFFTFWFISCFRFCRESSTTLFLFERDLEGVSNRGTQSYTGIDPLECWDYRGRKRGHT